MVGRTKNACARGGWLARPRGQEIWRVAGVRVNGSGAGPRGAGRSSSRASRGTSPGLRERRRAPYPHPPRELRQAVVHIDIFLGAVHELIALPARGEGRSPPLSPCANSCSRLARVAGLARSPPCAPWSHGTSREGRWAWAAVPHGRSRPRPTFCGRLGARWSPVSPNATGPERKRRGHAGRLDLTEGRSSESVDMASPTSPGPEGGACTPQNPPRIRQVGAGCRVGAVPHVLASPKDRGHRPQGTGTGPTGDPFRRAWALRLAQEYSGNLFFTVHFALTPLPHPHPHTRAFLNQECNFCPCTLRHTRKLISLRSTEAHTQLSHDPLQSYTVRSHSGC